jgi:hypothetical protein
MVAKAGEFRSGLPQHLHLRNSMYGYIGLADMTLYPLIRPGSLVEIDPSQRKIGAAKWRTEFANPDEKLSDSGRLAPKHFATNLGYPRSREPKVFRKAKRIQQAPAAK